MKENSDFLYEKTRLNELKVDFANTKYELIKTYSKLINQVLKQSQKQNNSPGKIHSKRFNTLNIFKSLFDH